MTNAVIRNANERVVADYWDHKQDTAINTPPSEFDLYHHHLGIGRFDRSVLQAPARSRNAGIMAEIHRMETEQVSLIVNALGRVPAEARGLDAGCGRGGTSFVIHKAFGCRMDGVSLSHYQVDFANAQAEARECADAVRFHHRNMCATEFPDACFDFVVANEADMYVDLAEAYQEFARVLRPGGRFVFVTWCCNDAIDPYCAEARAIDENYPGSHTAPRSLFFTALAQAGLVPITVTDYTTAPIAYLELRSHADGRTGVEQPYLEGFRNNTLNYMLVAAERVITAAP